MRETCSYRVIAEQSDVDLGLGIKSLGRGRLKLLEPDLASKRFVIGCKPLRGGGDVFNQQSVTLAGEEVVEVEPFLVQVAEVGFKVLCLLFKL